MGDNIAHFIQDLSAGGQPPISDGLTVHAKHDRPTDRPTDGIAFAFLSSFQMRLDGGGGKRFLPPFLTHSLWDCCPTDEGKERGYEENARGQRRKELVIINNIIIPNAFEK